MNNDQRDERPGDLTNKYVPYIGLGAANKILLEINRADDTETATLTQYVSCILLLRKNHYMNCR